MDTSEYIIENVKLHECLYNMKSKDYKNVQKKVEIWKQIGGLVNLSGEACRKRWKGLRDSYRRKCVAQLSSGRIKKWKYMRSLEFLNDHKFTPARPGVLGQFVEITNDFENFVDCSSSNVLNDSYATTDEGATQPAEVRPKKYTKKNADAEKASVENFKEVMKECADSVEEVVAIPMNANESRDPTTMLFEFLAKKIKKSNLPQSVVDRIEEKVFNLVYEVIAQNLTP